MKLNGWRLWCTLAVMPALLIALGPGQAIAQPKGHIVDLWDQVSPPPKPELTRVTLNPARTVLLILDIEQLTCNQKRRPRCLETVPRIAALLKRARAAGMPVVYSLTPRGTPQTILAPVKPQGAEPIVQSSVDKFFRTDLEKVLSQYKADTVIVTGTAAHGAVAHTATGASMRGLKVILPVDCLSAADLYTEQAAVWHLKTGPGTRRRITLTSSELIDIKAK